MLVALGLFDSEDALPADHVPVESSRSWWTSRIMPFLGHVGLERLHCADSPDSVRLIVNESPVSIPGCQDGKGGTCPLKDFEDLIESRKKIYHDFETGCRKD